MNPMNELFLFLIENKEWLISAIAITFVSVMFTVSSTVLKMKESENKFYLYWIKRNAPWLFGGISVFLVSVIISIASNIYTEKTK